jgi:hypothetical protein
MEIYLPQVMDFLPKKKNYFGKFKKFTMIFIFFGSERLKLLGIKKQKRGLKITKLFVSFSNGQIFK